MAGSTILGGPTPAGGASGTPPASVWSPDAGGSRGRLGGTRSGHSATARTIFNDHDPDRKEEVRMRRGKASGGAGESNGRSSRGDVLR